MRKVVLFIAMSLDGYIADMNGSVDWLNGQSSESENEDTYSQFAKDIDTVVMGWKTYHQIISELSPSKWVYSDFISYVVTHKEETSTEKIRFVYEAPSNLIRRLKEENGKDIWICGGASIVQQLMQDGLIDKFYISIIPAILGSGIRLFGSLDADLKLNLTETRNYNGIVEVVYEKR